MAEVQSVSTVSPEMIAARERAVMFAAENIPPGPMRAMLIPQFREALLQQAGMLLDSYMVPEHFWPKEGSADERRAIAKANVVAALFIATELGESAFAVMPQIYFIGGRPAWKTEFLRARIQKIHGITLRFSSDGKGESLAVTAYASPPTGGEAVSVTVMMREAVADGWTKNPKYRTLPERMLQERAASRWISLYAPMIKGGVPDALDMSDDTAPAYVDMARAVVAVPAPASLPETRQIVAPAPVDDFAPEEEADRRQQAEPIPADEGADLAVALEEHAQERGVSLAKMLGDLGCAKPLNRLSVEEKRGYLARLNGGAK